MATVKIYTDGGCSPNPGLGGYAALLFFEDASGTVHERTLMGAEADTTNQRMELRAAVEALEVLTQSCDVTLFTDSTYVLKGITEWLPQWIQRGWQNSNKKTPAHQDLWERIHQQLQKHTVTVQKVKAHSGDVNNERVDQLVSEARDNFHHQQSAQLADTQPQPELESEQPSGTDKPYRLLIAGSRHASENMLEYARRVVNRAIELNWQIVVGDNPQGVDLAVVEACKQRAYTDLIVVGIASEPRNGGVPAARYVQIGRSYTERDRYMAQAVNRGIYISDGKSSGTLNGARYMRQLGKPVNLFDFSSTFTA